ncbi:SIR2 family protein [Dickeya dianthicola]|uniref:SIR2 family protein n=1 Tax=Dickeya dianthicola TaxID=204039 RepID=UPI00301AE9F3
MPFSNEIEAFIKDYVKDLSEDSAAIFAGAGMSKSQGFVDWPELLSDIADELGLSIDKEKDLISLAQFHVNTKKNANKLTRKIIEEFSEQADASETHRILSRLPIRTYWTTNYDSLIEDSLEKSYKIPDVKYNIEQLNNSRPKRDAVIYKMHGDVKEATKAVLYKEQYERYYQTHAPFITALSGDLISKTFLFIGFSFTDPNLDYILSRLYTANTLNKRTHYCFMKEETDKDQEVLNYKKRKQNFRIDDLKRFGIETLLINDYEEIPKILSEIEFRYLKKTVFISGSAEEFGKYSRQEAQNFIHDLASSLVKNNYRVVNGFGWGVGSAVINGALEAVYSNPKKYSEEQLVMKPFPQSPSKNHDLKTLWEEYRQRMISLAGIALFIFGNKCSDKKIINAQGVRREFEIAKEKGLILIPISPTGYISQELYTEIEKNPSEYYGDNEWVFAMVKDICSEANKPSDIINKIIDLINRLNK